MPPDHRRRPSLSEKDLLMSQMSEFWEVLSSTTSEICELQRCRHELSTSSRPPTPKVMGQGGRSLAAVDRESRTIADTEDDDDNDH
mmetsp:Transcript_36416/g.109350  ORF Transcript_36416/g.109350 Transcript_36416/m.109350 type:complete len:86 (+) Transcript_36416:548-805(+)